jgi:hypothetical protein
MNDDRQFRGALLLAICVITAGITLVEVSDCNAKNRCRERGGRLLDDGCYRVERIGDR